MTLDEAIKKLEETVIEEDNLCKDWDRYTRNHNEEIRPSLARYFDKCAAEHRQLIEWLKELKLLKEKKRWISVSERLPKIFEYVNCTCHSLIDDREDWVIETCYVPQPSNSPYSDWGNIPMLNRDHCKVVAWMHRDIPKPYKVESEG